MLGEGWPESSHGTGNRDPGPESGAGIRDRKPEAEFEPEPVIVCVPESDTESDHRETAPSFKFQVSSFEYPRYPVSSIKYPVSASYSTQTAPRRSVGMRFSQSMADCMTSARSSGLSMASNPNAR